MSFLLQHILWTATGAFIGAAAWSAVAWLLEVLRWRWIIRRALRGSRHYDHLVNTLED